MRQGLYARLRDDKGKQFAILTPRGATSLALVGNRIIVGGGVDSRRNGGALMRLRANGALDRTFGRRGVVRVRSLHVAGLALGPCGRIVAAGPFAREPGDDIFGAIVLGPNGERSHRSRVRTPFGKTYFSANGVSVDSAGRVVVAGGLGNDFGVARLRGPCVG